MFFAPEQEKTFALSPSLFVRPTSFSVPLSERAQTPPIILRESIFNTAGIPSLTTFDPYSGLWGSANGIVERPMD